MQVLGAVVVLYFVYQVLIFIHLYLPRAPQLQRYYHGSNTFAFISGATDDAGISFAKGLCRQKFNLILHGRSNEKLIRTQSDLQHDFPKADIRLLTIDTMSAEPRDVETSLAPLSKLQISILVNNVGGTSGIYPTY